MLSIKTYGIILISVLFIAGCSTVNEGLRGFLGISTKILEDGKKDAITASFDYDYPTCYAMTEVFLKKMVKVEIYDASPGKRMIAFYYAEVNTTPVGAFFEEVDKTRTRVLISSPSANARSFMAKKIFSALGTDKK